MEAQSVNFRCVVYRLLRCTKCLCDSPGASSSRTSQQTSFRLLLPTDGYTYRGQPARVRWDVVAAFDSAAKGGDAGFRIFPTFMPRGATTDNRVGQFLINQAANPLLRVCDFA